MKKVILLLLSACSIFACTHTPKWELVWEDNFDGAEPDTSVSVSYTHLTLPTILRV